MSKSKPCGKGHISARLRCHAGQNAETLKQVGSWTGGKVAGKLAGQAASHFAATHGVDPGIVQAIGESVAQGLISTAMQTNKSDRDLVGHFLSVAAGAFMGKVSIGTDDSIFGGDHDVKDYVATLASANTIQGVTAIASRHAGALRRRVGLRTDADDDRDLFMLAIAAYRVAQLRQEKGMNLRMVQDTLDKYGLTHLDAKQVLRKIGGRRPGKRCKGGWIAADKQCSDHKTADGKLTAAGKASARELADKVRARKGMVSKNAVTNRRLAGLDDRIKKAQKTSSTRKASATKSRAKELSPSQINTGDRKQAVAYNEQGAQRAKAEGRLSDGTAWERESSAARVADIKSRQRQINTSQGELFGIEETTDLPLFRQRKDGFRRRFDRAMDGGKKRSTRKKANCSPKSQQCGAICIPLTSECRDGAVGSAQERLKKLKRSGADDIQVQRAKESIKSRTAGKRSELADRRIKSLRGRLKNSSIGSSATPGGLAELDPNSIAVDPKRFQYKIIGEHTASGSVGSLSGVRKYDPNLAGILQVWQDPADGKTYVVNGHNRLDLAKKLGAGSVAVRYLKSPDAKSARAIGALTNIAEGRGDALDAAKFFRDTGISKEDLGAKGIPMREKIATDGLALSKLDDSLFRRTIDGDIPMARAAIVGGSGLDSTQQRDLMKLVDKEAKRKNLTDAAISEMVDIAKSAQTSQETTLSLFGEETVARSNMIEKAKLQASIKQRLSREKNLFGVVSRGKAAQELARGGNSIDAEKSGEISTNADRALKQFDQMKNLSGPVSDAINRAATRISNGESQKSVEKDLYEQISSIDIFRSRQKRAA